MIKRDIKNRLLFLIYEKDKKIIKSIALNQILPLSMRIKAFNRLSKLPSITKIRNICILTGRTRGIITPLKISRIMFRTLADNAKLPGIRKSTW